MRVTDGMRYQSVLKNLGSLQERHAAAMRRALTGSKLEAPSSDPSGAAELVRVRSAQSQAGAQRGAIANARGAVELAEGALAEAGDLLARARELAMQGRNGSLRGEDRANLAEQVNQLKEQLRNIANTRGTRGYIFAGTDNASPPFDASGAFGGNASEPVIQIGNGAPTAVGVSGALAFTVAGGRDVFTDLENLHAALAANDADAVGATLDGLEASHKQVVNERGRAGLTLERLETSDTALEQLELSLGKRENQVAAADPFEAYSSLNQLGQSLEQAVAVGRRIFDMNLTNRF
jgi:flagellar hook-associated protein 3 FlgL